MSGYSLTGIPKKATEAAGTGAWFSLLLLAIIFAVGSIFITTLNKKFEGKTIYEFSALLIGNGGARFVTIIYSLYFLLAIILVTKFTGIFITSSFLPMTPLPVMIFILVITSSYIGSRGITNIARMSEIYGIVFIITMILLHIIMLFFGDVKYIMPFFEVGQIKRYITGMSKLIVPFLGLEIMLAIPFGRGNQKGTLTAFFAIIFLGLLYIFSSETSVMITGPHSIVTTENALVEALRETRIPSTFLLERPDLIYILVGIAGFLSTLSVLFHMVNTGVSHIITKTSDKNYMLYIAPVVFIVGAFVLNDKVAMFLFDNVIPIYGLISAFLIPIIMLIIAKAKKL